ncbi:DUF805 domain-containing protein [Qipengyuania sp. 1NDH17]|uniref:DUF805 domain-containing protein n=1 Tax=Qipengyuania polymorpha TaxID=2867234 RepID=A0ABS7IVS7_9SPHN|nr:DUF805 domain-containing protein [Qipengyuania polymorpha]MBX7457597.1 DUF805 domain-containing protein [Qipengyuania polymorpha]
MKAAIVRFWRRFNDENLLFSFHGRATRREFLLCLLIAIASLVLTIMVGDDGFSLFVALLCFGIFFAAAARRLHDAGSSAWTALIIFVPYAGIGFLAVIMLKGGMEGPNEFGPDPRNKPKYY